MSQPRRSLPDSRWTAMPHPRIASPHGCNYRLIPVPINPGGWSSRQTPSPRPIRRLCRSHSLMFETDRTHTKCMCDLSEEKMFSADFVVFSPSRGPQVLCRAKIPRAAPVATWRANTAVSSSDRILVWSIVSCGRVQGELFEQFSLLPALAYCSAIYNLNCMGRSCACGLPSSSGT